MSNKAQSVVADTTTATMLEQHPLALQIVPGDMPDTEFDAFCEDLTRNGLINDIVLYEDKILDGMTRYRGCRRTNIEPRFTEYKGADPAGFVIALNVLRRKLGTTQRARAGAELNLNHGITQDEAARRVGVSKVHINLVVQVLKHNNTRLIKLLEDPDLTREGLKEEMMDCGLLKGHHMQASTAPVQGSLSAQGATAGLENFFAHREVAGEDGDPEITELLGGDAPDEDSDVTLEGVLGGEPPSAGGKVISFKSQQNTDADGNVVGTRPSHSERRAAPTPAQLLAERFKGLPEAEQVSFMQITWPIQRKLVNVAGLSLDGTVPAKAEAKPAPASKPTKATTAQAAAAAKTAIDEAKAKATGKATKAPKAAKTPKATAKAAAADDADKAA